jgi:alpha-beta hydrolase superfamily lysophospholipase
MTAQAHRGPSSRTRSWLLYPVFAVMAFSAAGCGYERIEAGSGRTPAPVAGDQLLDVGGHRLNIRCVGSGSPAVVVESGLGESASAIARWIAPQVGRTTRVCVYDRAGHGRSDVAPDTADAASDLHALLARAHVPAPFVMAGHSLGGAFVLSYARRYPSQGAASCSWTPCTRSRPTQLRAAWVMYWLWCPRSDGPASLACSPIQRTGNRRHKPGSSSATSSRCPPS